MMGLIRVQMFVGSSKFKLSFSCDATSNILGNGHDTYSYDSLNRLTQAGYEATQNKKSVAESFNYDPMGNRLTSLATQTKEQEKNKKDDKIKTDTTNYMSNILNQYTSVDKTKLIYDKNGNLVNNGVFRFSYDYRNRLVEVKKIWEKGDENEEKDKKEQFMAKFSYDVLGRRASKEAKEQITKYTYSNQNTIEESEYKKDDGKMELTETRENIYGQSIDDIIATLRTKYEDHEKKQKSETYFYQKNQLGSITAISDDKGKVVEEYRYNAFGKIYIRDGKSDNWREFKESKVGNNRLFTGREYDSEVWLYYYRARYYSADLGRFISRDPIGTADNVNLYSYVGNSPIGFVDPMGREKKFILEHDATLLLSNFMQESKNSITASDFPWFTLTARSLFQESEYNIKYNQDFLKLWFKEPDSNLLKVFVSGEKVAIIDLWNFLIGYNWFQAGFTLNNQTWSPFNDIYQAWLFTEDIINRGNYANDPLICKT